MSCESTDNDLKLAKEYKSLLSYIRPLIQQLDRSKDAQLCLLWLSKLDQCTRWEKFERNQILSELCSQVKRKRLERPFNSQPPDGPLRNILLPTSPLSTWRSDHFSDLDYSSEETFSSATPNTSEEKPAKFSEREFFAKLNDKKSFYKIDHSECLAIQKDYQERAMNDQLMVERYQQIIKSLISQQLKTLKSSPKELKKIQLSYEKKVSDLSDALEMMQQENDKLKKKVEVVLSHSRLLNDFKARNNALEKKVAVLEETNRMLENKQKDLEKERADSAIDLRSKMNDSEKKWMEAEKQLQEAESILKSMEKKCEETLLNYKKTHQMEINDLESKYTNEISNLEHLLQEKEAELSSLKAHDTYEISPPNKRQSKINSVDKEKKKIQFLKNKAKKLEKLQESMANAFQSQLHQIINRKDLHIAALEMQLQAKNAETGIGSGNLDLNQEFLEKIKTLEMQYRKMLEESESQAIKKRKMDLQRIHILEKKLLACGATIEEPNPESPVSINK